MNTKWFRTWLLGISVVGFGCDDSGGGGGESEAEGEDDGGVKDAESEPDAGPLFTKLPRKAGMPLIVNDIDELYFAALDVGGFGVNAAIQNGTFLAGFELLGLEDPEALDDDEVTAAFEVLYDLDGTAGDNFSGSEPLCIEPTSLDAETGYPLTTLVSVLEGGVLNGSAGRVNLPELAFGVISIPPIAIRNVILQATVEQAATRLCDGQLDGQIWASDLASIEIAGINVLEVLRCGFGTFVDPTPLSVDVDGDGLEEVACNEDGEIVSCIDFDDAEPAGSDPVTIEGADCGADLEDGYDFHMAFSAISYVVAGVCTAH